MAGLLLKIKRQDDPMDLPYWEIFEIRPEPGMSLIDALRSIERQPLTSEGNPTAPVLWDCSCEEGLCGACTVLVNGRARQACGVMLSEFDGPVTLEPMTKYPVVRDLVVDRSSMLEALSRSSCWVEADRLGARGELSRFSREESDFARFLDCVMCGACSEACPQVNARSAFAGAFVFSRVLPINRSRAGKEDERVRLSALAGRGGVADCAGAENCERACPRGLALVKASAILSWDVAKGSLASFFRG